MAKAEKQSYLLTSVGFFNQFVTSLACIAVSGWLFHSSLEVQVRAKAALDWASYQLMEAAYSMAWWSLLGLLSSSCCALQILLNLFSFGCAGFNTWLGPMRPTFIALTLAVQITAWCIAWNRPYQWLSMAASSTVTASLTLLPELLALRARAKMGSGLVPEQNSGLEDETPCFQATFTFTNFGCISCVNTVHNSLVNIPGVYSAAVSLPNQTAVVLFRSDSILAAKEFCVGIAQTLKGAGFPTVEQYEGGTGGDRMSNFALRETRTSSAGKTE